MAIGRSGPILQADQGAGHRTSGSGCTRMAEIARERLPIPDECDSAARDVGGAETGRAIGRESRCDSRFCAAIQLLKQHAGLQPRLLPRLEKSDVSMPPLIEGGVQGPRTLSWIQEAIDETVLALLSLTLHEKDRAWKGHDWDALNRLHEKGFIHNPRSN